MKRTIYLTQNKNIADKLEKSFIDTIENPRTISQKNAQLSNLSDDEIELVYSFHVLNSKGQEQIKKAMKTALKLHSRQTPLISKGLCCAHKSIPQIYHNKGYYYVIMEKWSEEEECEIIFL